MWYSLDVTCDMTDQHTWEALCERCGLCCFEKIEDEKGTIFFTRTPCRYLDVVSRECRVYERRFAINPECVKLTPELVRDLNWLHDGCAYRKVLHECRNKKRSIKK
jgi:uncharacterized cysteine cluster protein YcgN (CxxCxxCC family)